MCGCEKHYKTDSVAECTCSCDQPGHGGSVVKAKNLISFEYDFIAVYASKEYYSTPTVGIFEDSELLVQAFAETFPEAIYFFATMGEC